jgi:serine/threonine-protein phosphatase 4 regulatory subunit 1
LCEDGVWGVRKACADVFMPVSCVCSQMVRRTELAPLFINLLRDQSRWVRMAAFQALGPFISTFADPAITALLHNDNGEIVITDPELLAKRLVVQSAKRQRLSVGTLSCLHYFSLF